MSKSKVQLIFSKEAYAKIAMLLLVCNEEVGWHGTVEREGTGFYVKDIFLYPQMVTSARTTTDDLEYVKWLYGLDRQVFNHLRLHGHSHVRMCVSPSPTDENHRKDLLGQDGLNFYVFIIMNKYNDINVDIYDCETGVQYKTEDIDISIDSDFESEIHVKVKSMPRKATGRPELFFADMELLKDEPFDVEMLKFFDGTEAEDFED